MAAPPGAGPEALGGGPGRPRLRDGMPRTGAAGARPACGSATLRTGDTPRPSGVGPPPISKSEEASRKMERHLKQLHVRMSDRERESAKGLVRKLGMTALNLPHSRFA